MKLKTALTAAKAASLVNDTESYFVIIDDNSYQTAQDRSRSRSLDYDYLSASEYYNDPTIKEEDVIYEIFEGRIEEVFSDQARYIDLV